MLKAVVFDMDETLLSINLNAFILRYFKDVSSMLADIGRRSRGGTMARLGTILVDLNANRRSGTDNRTNLEFYRTEVERRCGICLSDPLIYEAFTYYDREVLPHKNDDVINAHAMPGAHAALQAVQDAGLRCALFTNPSFPQGAIECRMGWGDLADAPFELVTHMGNTTRCKPDATYYLWWATIPNATSRPPIAASKPPLWARASPAEPPGAEPWKTSPATLTP